MREFLHKKSNFGLDFAVYKEINMRPLILIGLIATLIASSLEGKAQYREEFVSNPSVSKSIHIYPNPTNDFTDFVNIRVSPLKAHHVKLALHNIIGNEVTVDKEIVDEHELRIKVKDLASGYYLLTVQDQENNFRGVYKILKR